MDLILGLFVLIIVLGVVFWGTNQLLSAFAVPAPIATVIKVLLVVVCLFVVLNFFGLMPTPMRLSR